MFVVHLSQHRRNGTMPVIAASIAMLAVWQTAGLPLLTNTAIITARPELATAETLPQKASFTSASTLALRPVCSRITHFTTAVIWTTRTIAPKIYSETP